ncbi:uncharacterized protein LOC144653022 [Oculina patagonica]
MAENERAGSQPIPITAGQTGQQVSATVSSPIMQETCAEANEEEGLSDFAILRQPEENESGESSLPLPIEESQRKDDDKLSQPTQESQREGNEKLPLSVQETRRGGDGKLSQSVQETEETAEIENTMSKLVLESEGAGVLHEGLPCIEPHFVNRKNECQRIRQCLASHDPCRFVLLHGPTGIGKTSTAIKVIKEMSTADDCPVIMYINCRPMKRLDDFAWKIVEQLNMFPSDTPITEVKRRLQSQKSYTVLAIDNFDILLHLSDKELMDAEQLDLPSQGDGTKTVKESITEFLRDIVASCEKVKLLVTSTEKVDFPCSGRTLIELVPFGESESRELLTKVYEKPVEERYVDQLTKISSGIPLVLYSLASLQDDLAELVGVLTSASPEERFFIYSELQEMPEDQKIYKCLEECFKRLNPTYQETLMRLSLFPGPFSFQQAVQVFSSVLRQAQMKIHLLSLVNRSFVQQIRLGTDTYLMHSVLSIIKDYCLAKARRESSRFAELYSGARDLFIDFHTKFLEENFPVFLSSNPSRAIKAFRQEEANIIQVLEWCGDNNVGMDEKRLTACIDVFNHVGEFLSKMMGKEKFLSVFSTFRKKCQDMKDKKRLSECLTSLGIKEVFSCSCPSGLCVEACDRAKQYLLEADKIQTELGINSGNSRAQCLAKLGRCLAREGNEEGKRKIHRALEIREKEEGNSVMLGATFNDMGVAHSLEGNHDLAINIRKGHTLPIYEDKLGEHPFTATILNNLANNFYALKQFEEGVEYSNRALRIRRTLLMEHQDTAKSLFDLGMAYKEMKEWRHAKTYLKETVAMQEKVLDEKELLRSRSMLAEVIRELGEVQP